MSVMFELEIGVETGVWNKVEKTLRDDSGAEKRVEYYELPDWSVSQRQIVATGVSKSGLDAIKELVSMIESMLGNKHGVLKYRVDGVLVSSGWVYPRYAIVRLKELLAKA